MPALTGNGARVPVVVEMEHPMAADHTVAIVRGPSFQAEHDLPLA
jgi:hypothetical protein